MKLLLFDSQINWELVKLFEREAEVLRRLHHAQIPAYWDYFSLNDRLLWFALVQDYVPGASLKALLEAGQHFTEAMFAAQL